MRWLPLLALLVLLLAGCGWASLLLRGGGSSSVHSATTRIYPSAPVNPVSSWVKVEHLPKSATRGAALFYAVGCNACHTYAGFGTKILHAPDLTAIGSRHLGIEFQIRHLQCPSCVNPGSPMPPFKSLGPRRLRELAIFLEASKGTH
jgi:mono/diheme cytochrome c family protein